MSFGSKHARKEGLSFTFDTSHIQEYVTLRELNSVNKPGHVYPIRALFISKGKFGEHPTGGLLCQSPGMADGGMQRDRFGSGRCRSDQRRKGRIRHR